MSILEKINEYLGKPAVSESEKVLYDVKGYNVTYKDSSGVTRTKFINAKTSKEASDAIYEMGGKPISIKQAEMEQY